MARESAGQAGWSERLAASGSWTVKVRFTGTARREWVPKRKTLSPLLAT
jgi:hypothetical protein